MKHAVLLAVVLLASCAKEDRPVRYSATCDRCDLWYQSDAKTLTLASLDGSWNVFATDTVVTLVDTTYTIDSTRVLATWSIDVSLEHNARPILRGRNFYGSQITEIRMDNAGEVSSAVLSGDMEEQTIH